MIGTTKEVFYEGADGISYMGTFQAAALGEVAQPAFAKLPKEVGFVPPAPPPVTDRPSLDRRERLS